MEAAILLLTATKQYTELLEMAERPGGLITDS